jgi:hypothetical protein
MGQGVSSSGISERRIITVAQSRASVTDIL